MARDIHLVEQGDSWEVWRAGDSMPLGTYVTRMEAEEHGQTQAAEDGVGFHPHGLDVDADADPTIET